MYIQQAYNSLHDTWRYLAGGVLIFLASQLGALPFVGIVMLKILSEDGDISILEDPNAVMTVLSPNLTLFLMLLSFAIGLAFLLGWVKLVHKQSFVSLTTSRKRIDWGRFAFGFGLIFVLTTVLTFLDYWGNPDDYVWQFDLVPFLVLTLIALVMLPLQTSFEEYLFRGYLMQGIGIMSRYRWIPLVITSVIFGGLHFLNPEVDQFGKVVMLYYIGTGFFLGIMTLMDEGMELALGFHAGNNIAAALLVTADWTVFQTNSLLKDISEPSAGSDVLVPIFIVYPVFLGIMAWKYKWTGWQQKLFGRIDPPPKPVEPVIIENDPNTLSED